MEKPISLNEQAQEILKIAEERGTESDFFFKTTFKRYLVQLQILNDLETQIKGEGATVTKEYVKGRKNLYANPAIKEYNATTRVANNTVATLMKIINSHYETSEPEEEDDPLLKALGII